VENSVAIVASAQTKYASDIGIPRERMLFETVKGFYDSLGITRHDIGTFIFASNDFQDGRTISNVFADSPVGAYMKDETKVESDGSNAFLYGVMRILSGGYDTALIIAYSLGGSQFRPYLVMDYTMDPVYTRQAGIMNELAAAALQTRAYMMKYGLAEEELASVAAKGLRSAAANPFSLRSMANATAADVLQSKPLYSPLHELHCYPATDGCCVMLLASEKRAKELTDKPVWVAGVGHDLDTYYLGEKDLAVSRSAQRASAAAYKMAGVKDPAAEIGVAELSAPFAVQELILQEALGLFPEGSGAQVIGDGLSEIAGKLPVTPSGGALGAHAFCASGLQRIADAASQLRGDAGSCQVADPKLALAHGQDGFCAQQNMVTVLATERG
jgi:acetyl-CoA C-acetyltransferase